MLCLQIFIFKYVVQAHSEAKIVLFIDPLPLISGARSTCLVLSVFRGMSEDHNRGVDSRPRNMEVNGFS